MTFITAFLWGTGLSLGMCVGLVVWAWLRPIVLGDRKDRITLREFNQKTLEALEARNDLTTSTNTTLGWIARAIEESGK